MNLDNPLPNAAAELYSALTSSPSELVKALAKAAIRQAADTMGDMFSDGDQSMMFNEDDIKEHAAQYTADMLGEFRDQIVKEIEASKFSMQINMSVVIKDES